MTNRIEVVTPEEADEVQYVVCLKLTDPLMLPDNIIGECCQCGCLIQHRPHIPDAPTACWECLEPEMDRERKKGALVMMITPKTAAELLTHIEKKKAN